MPRVGAKLQSKGWRNFEDAHQLQAALEGAVPEEARPVRVVGTPGDAMGVCAQVALWQSADVLLTPNGAHFVNAPFLAPGSVLIEGVPWSMRGYIGQTHATRWATGVHHLRLHSARPPASAELGRGRGAQGEKEKTYKSQSLEAGFFTSERSRGTVATPRPPPAPLLGAGPSRDFFHTTFPQRRGSQSQHEE